MATRFRASAVVRTRDSGETVVATLESLRRQSVDVEIVVVDSGSVDGTLELVEPYADLLVALHPEDFTFGGALNLGAAVARSEVHLALSSHCVLPHDGWVTSAVAHVNAGAVAAFGASTGPQRQPLSEPLVLDNAALRRHPFWGMTNHAAAWSAAAWRRHPFDETLTAAEDKEWSWRATADGGHVVADPALVVHAQHRRSAGLSSYRRRLVKEMTALEARVPTAPYGVTDALADWRRPVPLDVALAGSGARPLGRTRLVEVVARWQVGRLRAGR